MVLWHAENLKIVSLSLNIFILYRLRNKFLQLILISLDSASWELHQYSCRNVWANEKSQSWDPLPGLQLGTSWLRGRHSTSQPQTVKSFGATSARAGWCGLVRPTNALSSLFTECGSYTYNIWDPIDIYFSFFQKSLGSFNMTKTTSFPKSLLPWCSQTHYISCIPLPTVPTVLVK